MPRHECSMRKNLFVQFYLYIVRMSEFKIPCMYFKYVVPMRGWSVVRRCWVHFQCRGVILLRIIVGQGPIALAVGAGGGLFGPFFPRLSFSPLSPSLWVGWLVGCFGFNGPLRQYFSLYRAVKPKTTNQPTTT